MATFEIEANGETYEVEAPDQAAAIKALGSVTGQGAAAQNDQGRIPFLSDFNDFTGAVQSGVQQGMTLGFGDEINAGLETPFRVIGDLATGRGFDPGRAFGEGLEATRQYSDAAEAKNPIAATIGDIAGSIVTGGAAQKAGLTLLNGAKSLPGMVARGAAEGAAYGGLGGFGRGEGDVGDRLKGAQDGAILGGGVGGVLGGVAGAVGGKAAKAAVPTVDDLKAQAGALYDAAEQSGVTFAQPAVKTLADDITAKVLSEGIDPTLHPRATAALKRLQTVGTTGATVKDVRTLRRVLAAAGKDYANPDEGRIAGMMVEDLDDFVNQSVPELAKANKIYHQAKKGEMIEQAIELAGSRAGQFSGSGYENALRTEFRALERQIIKGKVKGLSPGEKSAIRHVARGGALENVLRFIGKAAPTGIVSAGLGTGVPFAIGNAFGGPVAGAAAAGGTMGVGLLGREAATRLAIANAERAALVARNGGVALGSPSNPLAGALIDATGNEAGAISQKVPLEILITGGNKALSPR